MMDGNRTAAPQDTDLFLVFNCTVLTFTLVLGLPGNLWVCWVVFRTKTLRTCNNALLVSLAGSDILKCSVDTPLLMLSVLRCGGGGAGAGRAWVSVHVLQRFTYALCSCVQLLTLVSISVERFQAIAFPFHTERRRARVRLWILSVWACGLVLALASLALSEKSAFSMLCRRGGERPWDSDPFGACVLVPLWGLSLTVITIHYGRIFRVVRHHRKKMFRRGIRVMPTVSSLAWVQGSAAPPGSYVPLPAVSSGSPPLARRTLLLLAEDRVACGDVRPVGPVCLLTPGARERAKKQMEGKLAKRFGYIIIAFTLFWVPMVVILLMKVAKTWRDTGGLLMELETSAMALTCVQAAADPFIYTLVTRQFRSELKKMVSSFRPCPLKLTC